MHSQCIAWTRRNFAFGRCCSRRFSTIAAWLKWKQSQMLAFSRNFWPERVWVQVLFLRLPANLGESEENCRWSGCSPPRNAWTRLKDTESVRSGSIFCQHTEITGSCLEHCLKHFKTLTNCCLKRFHGPVWPGAGLKTGRGNADCDDCPRSGERSWNSSLQGYENRMKKFVHVTHFLSCFGVWTHPLGSDWRTPRTPFLLLHLKSLETY